MDDVPTLTPRALLNAVIAEVASERRVDPELIKGRSNIPRIVRARALVAKRLLARIADARLFDEPEQRVADMMHVSLGTVQLYLGRRARSDSKVSHHKEDVSP